jgi:ADP-heptose:LPS heptosyltransferase
MLKQVLVDWLGKRRDLYAWRVYQAPLDVHQGARVCLLHLDGRLGDAVLNSAVVSAFQRHHPSMELWVGTTQAFVGYWSSHPFVKRAVVLRPTGVRTGARRFWEIAQVAKPFQGVFDIAVSFDPFVQLDTFFLLHLLQAKKVVGFAKPQYRLFDYSLVDSQFEIEREHITSRIERLLRTFGIDAPFGEFQQHVPTTPESDLKAAKLMGEPAPGTRSVMLNTYGGGRDKTFTRESTQRILDLLFAANEHLTVYLNLPTEDSAPVLDRYCGRVRALLPVCDLPVLFSCLRRVDGILTPDTSAGHIGAALGKPILCFFHDIAFGPGVWRPFSEQCEVLVSRGGTDVNDQDWPEVPRAIDRFLSRVGHAE